MTPHPVDRAWDARMSALGEWMAVRALAPQRTVVLVPYAQLMATARQAWARLNPAGFAPRFETSRNWASNLRPFVPGPADWSGDRARDSLVAMAFVDRVARARSDLALRAALASRLVEATQTLVSLAAAQDPGSRLAWGQERLAQLAPGLQSPAWEGLVASLAITWASSSAYPTDVLWSPLAAPGSVADALVVFQGFQADPLAAALRQRWGEDRAPLWLLHGDSSQEETGDGQLRPGEDSQHAQHAQQGAGLQLHACDDAEDEAQRASACVIRHLEAGRRPVGLLANDRLLTRRVSAMLHSAGVSVRDETGWKLSTTHAAAQVMAVLRAADARASMDDALDALKLSPAWSDSVAQTLEALARQRGVVSWRAALGHPDLAAAVPVEWLAALSGLQGSRPLTAWLQALGNALVAGGWWGALTEDAAGQQLIGALHLHPGSEAELVSLGLFEDDGESGPPLRRWSLAAFTSWAVEALEGAAFKMTSVEEAQVVILPMAQQVARAFGATVVPGCDERNLPTHPEPPAPWTQDQRDVLELPSRQALSDAALQAWQALLQTPFVDVVWRTQDRGEETAPNAWVVLLQAAGAAQAGDPRVAKALEGVEPIRPMPSAASLLPDRLSASAYQDLRDCPYRFFALRQLRLRDADELQGEPDQQDMGNWLHAVLRGFHEERGDERPGRESDVAALERWAKKVAEDMGLLGVEGQAGFLPYQAVWPAIREGYLDWLSSFEGQAGRAGPCFVEAEVERNAHAGRWRLMGKLDRIDEQPSPEGRISMVIDYKTERRERTLDRVKDPMEDTQLAFYAALLPQDNLRAAYLSITDKRGTGRNAATLLIEQPEVLLAREALLQGLERDMERVAAGQPMPALGEGRVCEFCAARGVCRRDDWSVA
jgi:ATP-dependent helicase/nuclease subunit B